MKKSRTWDQENSGSATGERRGESLGDVVLVPWARGRVSEEEQVAGTRGPYPRKPKCECTEHVRCSNVVRELSGLERTWDKFMINI